jgi:hypothetical protein
MANISVIDITKALKGVDFPAEKEDLIDYARENGADEEILQLMEEMPEEEYGSMSDVMSAFGEIKSDEAD